MQKIFAVIPFMDKRLLQIFVHVTTAVLSWHVDNFVEITPIIFGREQNEISIIMVKIDSVMVSTEATTTGSNPAPFAHWPERWYNQQ